MKLNSVEYWMMNNPIRALVQRYYEAPRLRQISQGLAKSILEIGCGQGVGAKIIYDSFSPEEYVGIDLDPRMVERATRRTRELRNAVFLQGDASDLQFDDERFDLVVDFGIVHHIPNWRDALAEIHRTLKPGGQFLFEDLSLETWETGPGRLLKRILEHPYDQMFRLPEFVDELEKLGFSAETQIEQPFAFRYFFGQATKTE